MAIPLILLAVGSVFAGYVGVPHALGGSNRIETFLEPSFERIDNVLGINEGSVPHRRRRGRGSVRVSNANDGRGRS